MKWRGAMVIAGLCLPMAAHAQFSVPVAKPDPATLFARQCGTCHVASAKDEPRQGPNLWGVIGRKAGTYPGFKYSGAYAASNITWSAETLDRYLTNPQAMIPGSVMAYRQANPEIRAAIIGWLKEQH
jgi:cytochrome c